MTATVALIALFSSEVQAQSGGTTQSSAITGPTFEVASIKPNKNAMARPRAGFGPGGRFEATASTVQDLITMAYGGRQGIRRSQIIGAPGWTGTERFDVRAQVENGAGQAPDQMLQMLQNLLADRFKLVSHRDKREQPIYALTFARSDRALGPQLRRADADCDTRAARIPPDATERAMVCGLEGGPGRAMGRTMTLSDFAARQLASFLDRSVVDRTGMEGIFDWDLQWSPGPGEVAPLSIDEPPPITDGPSIFQALQEQLGLKLITERGVVDVIVVDAVSRPTPD
jgi:uncharacterized protein (TIGR03435 family)